MQCWNNVMCSTHPNFDLNHQAKSSCVGSERYRASKRRWGALNLRIFSIRVVGFLLQAQQQPLQHFKWNFARQQPSSSCHTPPARLCTCRLDLNVGALLRKQLRSNSSCPRSRSHLQSLGGSFLTLSTGASDHCLWGSLLQQNLGNKGRPVCDRHPEHQLVQQHYGCAIVQVCWYDNSGYGDWRP